MAFYSLVLKLSRNSSKQFHVYTSEATRDFALRETLSRLAPYIRDYVQNAFGTEASEQEYIERIFARLEGQFGPDAVHKKVEAAVFSYLRSLVQNDRRTIFERFGVMRSRLMRWKALRIQMPSRSMHAFSFDRNCVHTWSASRLISKSSSKQPTV